jgi:acetolactate synthase-1/2/3 large subunit
MVKMTGGQALARQLAAEGVDTVFGLPGVQIMAAFDALYNLRDRVRLVHVRHEQATTYMAFGYAASTGRPGVALVVPGPGALNATAGLGTAYACSQPVLLISGQIPSGALGKRQGQLHEVDDQLDVFRPITKHVQRVTKVAEIPEAVHEAFRHLKTGRSRPVELEVPPDTLLSQGEAELIEPEEYPKPAPKPADIRRAAAIVAAAQKPVIFAGGGVVAANASRELVALAEFLQAPVITSRQAKGAIPSEHELCLGVYYAQVSPAPKVVPECDVLLAVGTRLQMDGLQLRPGQKLAHIDVDPDTIGKNYTTEVGIEADAKLALAALLKRLTSVRGELIEPQVGAGPAPQGGWRHEELEGHKRSFEEGLRRLAPEQTAMLDAVRAELADDDILVSGMTNVGYWGHLHYPARLPRTYLTSSYFGTLGYAFPTSLGAKVAHPGKRVVSLNGDGGFMFNAQELSTAAAYGINVVAIVFNNGAFGASQWDQTYRFGKRFIGTELRNPDFMKLAAAFGVKGIRTEPEGLGRALRRALALDAPVLIEVPLPNLMPPFQLVK